MTYTIADNIKVELTEKEIIDVKLYSVDILSKTDEVSIPLFVYNETPTEITSVKFRTANDYRTGSLSIYLNGMKLHSSDVTENSTTDFTISISKISTDVIEVNYIKQV